MFYPVESLKRGGRFYLCWVADSWPLRFATITHRQLWSQDIRRICDDLMEVMTNESGRPSNRFSLRLSSQLMRGLVRLYQRKVTIFLGDLCMINANVTKNVNKKWNIHEVTEHVVHRPLPQLPRQTLIITEEPENEPRVEEMIQNSGNVVGNIQEITLRETALPEIIAPVNDGFGEENPEQALQMLRDQTLEMMLAQDSSVAQHSGLELLDATGDKSHDKSRGVHDAPQMERISEHDVTLFRKSVGDGRMTMEGQEKDIPEIPEIQLPDLSGPPPEKQTQPEDPQIELPLIPEPEPQKEPESASIRREVVEIELEELEEQPQAKRRRLRNKLIIDKKIKLSADYLITRIENPAVELRCEDSSDDIVQIRVSVDAYFRRPAHAGSDIHGQIALPLTRLFQRSLGVFRPAADDREMEEPVAERSRRVRTRSALERIEEEAEIAPLNRPTVQIDQPVPELEMTRENLNAAELLNIEEQPNVTLLNPEDIADLPTQKLEILSQSRKRTSEYEVSPKRQRLMGYVSFRQSQQMAIEAVADVDANKENIPSAANVQSPPATGHPRSPEANLVVIPAGPAPSPERSLAVLLHAAGLADLPGPTPAGDATRSTRDARHGSDSSETQLGSLDRTKVSLGDSDQTTDSRRFIREQWGTEGTMVKILGALKARRSPLTVRSLVRAGPALAGHGAVIAARCFTSILKLKQHGFIRINKDPETLEIRDILLGPKFDQVK